jgi:hypothetical protein
MIVRKRNSGVITVEVITAITILGMLFFGFMKTTMATGRLNRLQLAKQQCIAAAQAQLDCIEATGERLSVEDFERLWPGQEMTIEELAGQDDWKGLRLVKVTTANKNLRKEVKVQLCRYIMAERMR